MSTATLFPLRYEMRGASLTTLASLCRTTPVSLPLTTTLPAPGTTILPTSITSNLPSHALPSHHPHSRSNSLSSSTISAIPLGPAATNGNNNNQTRILLLSDFEPELKTKDILNLFSEWEDDRGGLKIKWCDDVSCWIVFNDAGTGESRVSMLLQPVRRLARGGGERRDACGGAMMPLY